MLSCFFRGILYNERQALWNKYPEEKMGYHELDELGEKIQDIIDSAINEKNYQKLNQTH